MDFLAPQINPEAYKPDLEAGKITQREFELLLESNEKMQGPDGLMMLLIFMVCGEK
jgi:hypothetical protein